MKKINEQSYKDGQTAFHKGKTLRQIFEPMILEKSRPDADWEKIEEHWNSFTLGFADAFLSRLRTSR